MIKQPMKILIIEDQQNIANNEKKYLETEWREVDVVYDGKEWLQKTLNLAYDFVVVDRMLPGVSGVDIVHEVRKKKKIPIIMTTAKWQIEDKTEWFVEWVDDYLVKPFALEELVMRIKAIMKRTELPTVFRFWNIEMLLDEQRVLKKWIEIKLPLKEYLLLEYLLQRQWQAISRTDLIEYIRWGDWRENDNWLDVYIANIRKKLGKNLIETIKGFGYRVG